VLHAARWKCRTQKIAKHSPSEHHRTTLSGYIFASKACIDNRKKLLNSNTSSTFPHNMVNFGPLTARFWILGHPCKFHPVSRFGIVTARHSSSRRQPNCCVEQRAPPIFGRAAITLGFGLYFSSWLFCAVLNLVICVSLGLLWF